MQTRSGRTWAVSAALAVGITTVACTSQVPLPGVRQTEPDAAAEDAAPDGPAKKDAAPADRARDTTGDSICREMTPYVSFELNRPEMMIVFDRSYSMTRKFGDKSRLSAARQEVLSMVHAYQGGILFGFVEFPSRNSCDTGVACCASRVLVAPSWNAYFDIDQELRCETAATGCFEAPLDSPANDALMRVRNFFDLEPAADADRFILLVTDGSPSCGSDTSICDRTVAEASRLGATTGVKTIVVALGEDAKTSSCLDMVAAAGGMARAATPSYAWGGTLDELRAQLADAMAPVVDETCRLRFRTTPNNLEKVSVFLKFSPLPRDPNRKEGWNFDPPNTPEMRLYGTPCEKLRLGQIQKSDLRVGVTCTQCGSSQTCQ
jgi:hypothetical protein